MDPTITQCLIKNSFSKSQIESFEDEVQELKESAFVTVDQVPEINLDIKTVDSKKPQSVDPIFVDTERYNELQNKKDIYGEMKQNMTDKEFDKYISMANPFEGIGEDIFQNRAGVKLANIDSIFNISLSSPAYSARQTVGQFSFCDVAGAPGAWTQYMQYRRPDSIGYGISLKDPRIMWDKRVLNMERFTEFYGEDKSGDLYIHALNFSKFVKSITPLGVDFVGADGGMAVTNNERYQEFENSRLIFAEIYSAITSLKEGGNFVLKVYDTVTKFSADFLYILACCFQRLNIFKPMSSRPANAEKYIVAQGFKLGLDDFISVCDKVYRSFTDNKKVSQIFPSLPKEFEEWLIKINNDNVEQQMWYTDLVLSLYRGESIRIGVYNLFRAGIIWKLPNSKELVQDETKYLESRLFTDDDFFLNDTDKQLAYRRRRGEEKLSEKWGQRKLLMTLIQFLTNYWEPQSYPDLKVVYAGSAPGTNIEIVASMFPTVEFHLYDPKPFAIRPTDQIKLYHQKFTDIDAKKWSNREDVFFISDIRVADPFDPKFKGNALGIELEIIGEMNMQMKWYQIMNPLSAHLKFRLPYSGFNLDTLEYLDGNVFKQPWTGQSSTETRLVPFGIDKIKVWDAVKYESQMFYHNTVTREKQRFINPFTYDNSPVFIGKSNTYDTICEAMILKQYLEKFNKLATMAEVYKISNKLDKTLKVNKELLKSREGTAAAAASPSPEKDNIQISPISLNDKTRRTFWLIQEGFLPCGTKQRSLSVLMNRPEKELVYTGALFGAAQVAVAYAAQLSRKKATIFVNPGREGHPMLERAREYGANIRVTRSKLSDMQEEAKAYAKKTGAYLVPFGFDDPQFKEQIIRDLKKNVPSNLQDTDARIWVVYGSGVLLSILQEVFPKATFLVVVVGRKFRGRYPPRTTVYEAPQKFWEPANILPPYKSIPEYDAKVWQFVLKHGKSGDIIWNTASC